MNNTLALLFWTITLTLVGISGCGETTSPSESLNGAGYSVLQEGTLELASDRIEGSGSVIFVDPLNGIPSKHSYELEFSLEEGGQLSLISHAGTQLNGGLSVWFEREGTSLRVFVSAGEDSADLSSQFLGLDASETMTIQVDVHNDEEPAHLLAWTGEDFDEEAALFNSEEEGQESPGNGSGTFWGLELEAALLTQARVGAAKFVEGL